jgi:hypothetical protein
VVVAGVCREEVGGGILPIGCFGVCRKKNCFCKGKGKRERELGVCLCVRVCVSVCSFEHNIWSSDWPHVYARHTCTHIHTHTHTRAGRDV